MTTNSSGLPPSRPGPLAEDADDGELVPADADRLADRVDCRETASSAGALPSMTTCRRRSDSKSLKNRALLPSGCS